MLFIIYKTVVYLFAFKLLNFSFSVVLNLEFVKLLYYVNFIVNLYRFFNALPNYFFLAPCIYFIAKNNTICVQN